MLRRELDDRRGIAENLHDLRELARQAGDFDRSRRLHEEALSIQRAIGAHQGIAESLHRLGDVACARGDFGAAYARYRDGMLLRQQLSEWHRVIDSLEGIATVRYAGGEAVGAVRLFGAVAAIRAMLHAPVPRRERAEYARALDGARAQLPEETWRALWVAGQALSIEHAFADALAGAMPQALRSSAGVSLPDTPSRTQAADYRCRE